MFLADVSHIRPIGDRVRAAPAREHVGLHGEVRAGEGPEGGGEVQSDASVSCSAGCDCSGEAECRSEVRFVVVEASSVRRGSAGKRRDGGLREEYPERRDLAGENFEFISLIL